MRALNRIFAVLVSSLPILCTLGCQSPTGGGYPFQAPARVPPPATGSYQVPSSYYNNTGGNVSQVYQGADPRAAGQAMVNPQAPPGMSAANVQPAAFAAPASIQAPGAMPATSADAISAYPGTPAAPPPANSAVGSPPTNNGIPAVGANGLPSAPPPGNVAPGGTSSSIGDSNQVPSLQWQP